MDFYFLKTRKKPSKIRYNLKDVKRAKITLQKNVTRLRMVMYTSTGETEAGGSGIQSQLGLCSEMLFQNRTKQQIMPKGLAWSKAKILVIRREWCWCKDRPSDQGMLKESHHKCDRKFLLCEFKCAHMCICLDVKFRESLCELFSSFIGVPGIKLRSSDLWVKHLYILLALVRGFWWGWQNPLIGK